MRVRLLTMAVLALVAVAAFGCGDSETDEDDLPLVSQTDANQIPPPLRNRAQAQALIRRLAADSPFAADADVLASLTELGHMLYGEPGASNVGESRSGGSPDLPPDLAWPTVPRHDGTPEPMSFIGQIRLNELDPVAWQGPRKGLLSFFYASGSYRGRDPDEIARVLLLPIDGLTRRQRPRDDRDPGSAHALHQPKPYFVPRRWRPRVTAFIPWPGADALRPLGMDFEGERGDDVEAADELIALNEALLTAQGHDELATPISPSDRPAIAGSLGGWAYIDQYDPLEHAAGESSDSPDRWTLLLEVTESEHDVTAAFVIRKADLARGNFTRVYVESH